MELSDKAKIELRRLLKKEIGIESVSMLSDNDLNEIGVFLLTLTAESLKMKNFQKSI